jgi:hypothetical protein
MTVRRSPQAVSRASPPTGWASFRGLGEGTPSRDSSRGLNSGGKLVRQEYEAKQGETSCSEVQKLTLTFAAEQLHLYL